MTTKPSDAPWVDGPFPLIATPAKRTDLSNPGHFYIRAATGMAHAHNAIIRGLNAIILQAPNVPSFGNAGYKPRDVKDLLSFVRMWIKMVNHHHFFEETYIFPEMARFSGDPHLLEGPEHEHTLFQDGIERLSAYAMATRPDEYRWDGGMKLIIDSFSKRLTGHLYAEIDVFLGFDRFDSEEYKKLWVGVHAANDVFPCVYGCSDRTYEGGNPFPMMHWTLPYLIKDWFAVGNGAWRFNPSDWWCRPRPLAFGPSQPVSNSRT
ncbi:hypothetical protein F5Y17DRAFT_456916 [Xylariaceae sp. FL0594]|nr:hypothetical protein F5Y17DRAFT_456916 [Xylariaceae sp. FL0594]